MLWLLSLMRGIRDAAVPTLTLPGASSTEAEDGCEERRAQPGAAIPVPKHVPGEDPGRGHGISGPEPDPQGSSPQHPWVPVPTTTKPGHAGCPQAPQVTVAPSWQQGRCWSHVSLPSKGGRSMIKRRVLLGQARCPWSQHGTGKAGDSDREGHPFLWETFGSSGSWRCVHGLTHRELSDPSGAQPSTQLAAKGLQTGFPSRCCVLLLLPSPPRLPTLPTWCRPQWPLSVLQSRSLMAQWQCVAQVTPARHGVP